MSLKECWMLYDFHLSITDEDDVTQPCRIESCEEAVAHAFLFSQSNGITGNSYLTYLCEYHYRIKKLAEKLSK